MSQEGGLSVSFVQGPSPAGCPGRVTATVWDALAPSIFDGLDFSVLKPRSASWKARFDRQFGKAMPGPSPAKG